MIRCRPGSVIDVGGEPAVLSLFLSREGQLFALTAGHVCRNRTKATVKFFDGVKDHDLGEVHDWIDDVDDDVGILRISQPALCREIPEENIVTGDAYPVAHLGDIVNRSCRIYFGHVGRDPGTIDAALGQARLRVKSHRRSIPGDSGSPLFIDAGGAWQFVGQYVGLADDDERKLFQHPGPGLERLRFSNRPAVLA